MRLTAPSAKLGVLVAGFAGILLLTLGVGFAAESNSWAALTSLVGTVALVVTCARIFRGPSEEIAPRRPLWRTTERPTAGLIVAALLAIQAVASVLTFPDSWSRIIGLTAYGLLAVWFTASSIRLLRIKPTWHVTPNHISQVSSSFPLDQ